MVGCEDGGEGLGGWEGEDGDWDIHGHQALRSPSSALVMKVRRYAVVMGATHVLCRPTNSVVPSFLSSFSWSKNTMAAWPPPSSILKRSMRGRVLSSFRSEGDRRRKMALLGGMLAEGEEIRMARSCVVSATSGSRFSDWLLCSY